MAHSSTPSQRQLRTGELIRHALAGIFLRGETGDPDLERLTPSVVEVQISPDLKIAFSLRSNAAAIMKAASELEAGKTGHRMSQEMIAVNDANYPDGAKTRRLFLLDPNPTGHT